MLLHCFFCTPSVLRAALATYNIGSYQTPNMDAASALPAVAASLAVSIPWRRSSHACDFCAGALLSSSISLATFGCILSFKEYTSHL